MSVPTTAWFVYGEHNANPMPAQAQANIADFKRLNQGWNVELITLEESPTEYRDIFAWNKLAWSQVMRFDLILRYGGLYSDVDVCFYTPMLDASKCDLVLAIERHAAVSDAFFAAEADHPLMEQVRDKALHWCRSMMAKQSKRFSTQDLFLGAGVTMFSQQAQQWTGMDFCYQQQIHMAQADFGGRFHPENKIGLLPFEALCRHNIANWFGWHQCWGTWRPKKQDGTNNLSLDACLKATP